ncbi:Gfo/Idh/MocA family oxidoreductase [Azospirillum canadense]|uniref:Gfo/Idh/MocA family oxidoreductase n=1 Tax=Azospirillum canadense TaxID=403962 RepID=UPI0029CAC3EC|nr:Gfo/Idh/MocA family oxidoreductase [Azospirillum canadense]MCW2238629.1 putative dehydrogenase/acetyltransferase-like isoleucine patch superfamily enzyme [Azospirillum canadense]
MTIISKEAEKDDAPKSDVAPVPNSTLGPAVRVAVVGCGYWGINLVRNFHALGALAAISEASPTRADELSRQFEVPALPFEAVLADPAIHAVVLATPAETHAALAIRAIEAGKHVFVEKPLALAETDAAMVRRAAEAHGRVVMVGHLLQYHPAFLRLKQMVAEGRLGRLRYVYSNRLNLGKFRNTENVFWSFAPHDISMILALTGGPPDRVHAVGHSFLYTGIADLTTTHMTFRNGISGHIHVSWLHPVKEQKLVVVGDAGMAVFNDGEPWASKLMLYPHRVDWRDGMPEPNKADAIPIEVLPAEPLRLECLHFLDCVRDGKQPRTDVTEGIGVLAVLEAAQRSMKSGAAVDLTTAEPAAAPPPPPYTAHATACVDDGAAIGAGTKIWHFSHILKNTVIGRDCTIGQNVVIGPNVTVGDRCKIQNNVSLYAGVTLEDGVFCGPSCVFTNVNNPRAEVERKDEFRPTPVGRGATIGANATIVCGHSLGAYSFVAAGAVVTKDVPPHALVAGNPARRIGWMSHAGEKLGPDLVCPRTGTRYRLDGPNRLVEVVEEAKIA